MERDVVASPYGDFPSRYQCARLADICVDDAGVQTGPFGSQLHQRDYVPVGTPIITVEHLGENRILHRDLPRVSDEDAERLSRYSLRAGDIVFTRVGSVDVRALVRKEEEGWLFSGRLLRVRPNQGIIDSGYLAWFFGLPSFRAYVRKIAFGATMPSLNTKLLSDLPVLFPPTIAEQVAIAKILDALDDKIELNRRMNKTLEVAARALFKSWFVDFDPVRAKSDPPKSNLHSESIEMLPDCLVEAEGVEIPRGWTRAAIRDFSVLNPEAWGKDTRPSVVNYLDLSNVKWGRIEAVSRYARAEAPSRAQRVLRRGDTIVGTVRPGNGSYALVPEDGCVFRTKPISVTEQADHRLGPSRSPRTGTVE